MPIDEELDNQVDLDVDSNGDGGSNADGAGDQDEQDFLVVNDRTKFKTQEDAIKSFNEAGQTISRLSGWEKEMSRFGVADPQTASQLLSELVEFRNTKAKMEEAAKASGGKQATHTDEDENLSDEDKNALKWLKKHAGRLGFVPKEELTTTVDALKQDIEALKGNNQASTEAQFNALVDSGRESVRGWMTEQKIVDNADGEKQAVIEEVVRAWVNADQNRINRFYASPSSSHSLIKEGFDRAVKVLGWGKAAGTGNGSVAAALAKGQSLVRNGKRMPQAGAGRGKPGQQNNTTRVDAGGKKDFIGSAHNPAWEVANKHWSGSSAE